MFLRSAASSTFTALRDLRMAEIASSTSSFTPILLIFSAHSAYSSAVIFKSEKSAESDFPIEPEESVESVKSVGPKKSVGASSSIARKFFSSLIGRLSILMTNRSQSASSPSPLAGNSLLAATRSFRGRCISRLPLRKIFSLITVRSVFWIAGPAFQISSRKTTSAVGR